METSINRRLRQRTCSILIAIISLLAATSDVIAVDMTTVGSASVSERNLTLLLLTPLYTNMGFERNAAASTKALQQAQADGLLSDMSITYASPSISNTHFITSIPAVMYH